MNMRPLSKIKQTPSMKASPSVKVATPKNRSKRIETKNNLPGLMSSSGSSSSSTSAKYIRSSSKKSPSTPNSKAVKFSKCCVCAEPEEKADQYIQCSVCQRTYHQFCHFVPVIVIPRQINKWICLICKYKDEKKDSDNGCCAKLVKEVYPSCARVIKNPRTFEKSANFRFESSCANLKNNEMGNMLKNVKGSLSGCLGNIRCHQHTAQIYTDSLVKKAKRDSKQDIPLELIESYEKMSFNKIRCRDILDNLQNYILSQRPHEPRVGDKTGTCTICYSSVSSKDNKILRCDNDGCGRAMHMKCNTPHVTQYELDNDPDNTWFCCYCTAFANFIYYVQVEYEGDEEHIGEEWEDVEDVFVEADDEKALAKKMRKAMDLGEGVDYVWKELIEGEKVEEIEDEELEEDEEDEDFDIDTKEIEDNDDEDGDISSLASLSDDEVNTLHLQCKEAVKKKEKDMGKLDEENILKGKRKRTAVDYRKLNDEIFCDFDGEDIDDEEDYFHSKNSKKSSEKGKKVPKTSKNGSQKASVSSTANKAQKSHSSKRKDASSPKKTINVEKHCVASKKRTTRATPLAKVAHSNTDTKQGIHKARTLRAKKSKNVKPVVAKVTPTPEKDAGPQCRGAKPIVSTKQKRTKASCDNIDDTLSQKNVKKKPDTESKEHVTRALNISALSEKRATTPKRLSHLSEKDAKASSHETDACPTADAPNEVSDSKASSLPQKKANPATKTPKKNSTTIQSTISDMCSSKKGQNSQVSTPNEKHVGSENLLSDSISLPQKGINEKCTAITPPSVISNNEMSLQNGNSTKDSSSEQKRNMSPTDLPARRLTRASSSESKVAMQTRSTKGRGRASSDIIVASSPLLSPSRITRATMSDQKAMHSSTGANRVSTKQTRSLPTTPIGKRTRHSYSTRSVSLPASAT